MLQADLPVSSAQPGQNTCVPQQLDSNHAVDTPKVGLADLNKATPARREGHRHAQMRDLNKQKGRRQEAEDKVVHLTAQLTEGRMKQEDLARNSTFCQRSCSCRGSWPHD
mmetsp:Transcript_1030/g.3132  ORF Transcript_1030/g.3132 Transcript_1030/m.3132 type:complete len:110 (-) Transcript_1030:1472-1801(-)